MSADAVNVPVRVVLAGLEPMVSDFIRAALEQTGMTVVEATSCDSALAVVAASDGIGVLIVPTSDAGFIGAYSDALCNNPTVRCLTISKSQRRADLFELRLIGADVGTCGVVDAVEAAVAGPVAKRLS